MIQPSTGLSAIGPPWSQITAYDLNKGTILWQMPDGEVSELAPVTGTGSHAPRGGPVATGGGLLFVGTSSDRTFRAYDSDTGKVLWSRELPAAQEGVPAVYSAGGREYVAIAVGGNGLFSQNLKQPEPGPAASTSSSRSAPRRSNDERSFGGDERRETRSAVARSRRPTFARRAPTRTLFRTLAMEHRDATVDDERSV